MMTLPPGREAGLHLRNFLNINKVLRGHRLVNIPSHPGRDPCNPLRQVPQPLHNRAGGWRSPYSVVKSETADGDGVGAGGSRGGKH